MTGIQYSTHCSVANGANSRFLNGVYELSPLHWLNRRPAWISTYCFAGGSVRRSSQIMPWRERPQIQTFRPRFPSIGMIDATPKSSSRWYTP